MRNVAGEEQLLGGWRRGTAFFIPVPLWRGLGNVRGVQQGLVRWHGLGDIVQASPPQAKNRDPHGIAGERRMHPQKGGCVSTC